MDINKQNSLSEPVLTSSIALIQSAKTESNDFGSGFLIYRNNRATYWLTCAHVVQAVAKDSITNIRVGELPAQLIMPSADNLNSSLRNSFDLAVLRVEGLFKKKPVTLGKPRDRELRFLAAGHFQNATTKQLYLREVPGKLHVDSLNVVAGDKRAWVLDLEIDENFSLEPGYSGSPVFIPNTKRVIGVVEQRQASGKKGKAIAIDAANNIFQEIPELKGMLQIQTPQLSVRNRFANLAMAIIERPLRWVLSPYVKALLNWFLQEGFSTLAQKSSEYALSNCQELNEELQQFSSEKDRNKMITDFQWELEKYLERIYGSFLTDSQDLLERNRISPSLSGAAYESAFKYIKDAIPKPIAAEVDQKLDKYINILIHNLYTNS